VRLVPVLLAAVIVLAAGYLLLLSRASEEGRANSGILPTGAGATSEGCADLSAGTIKEASNFTPAELQRSDLPAPAINALDRPPADVGSAAVAALDGLPRRFASGSPDAAVQYYLDRPIGPLMTTDEFAAAGGIQSERMVRDPNAGYFVDALLQAVGPRAVPVEVGPYEGAFTWADPLDNGVRTHNLYWSDGTYEYALIGDRAPEALINIGRGLVCG